MANQEVSKFKHYFFTKWKILTNFFRSSSINNMVGVSQNIIDIVTAKKMQNSPIILNCLTNLERSSLVALTITGILALESDTPVIISEFQFKQRKINAN